MALRRAVVFLAAHIGERSVLRRRLPALERWAFER